MLSESSTGPQIELFGPHTLVWVGGILGTVVALFTLVDAFVRLAVGIRGEGSSFEPRPKGRAKTGNTPSTCYPSNVDVQMSEDAGGVGAEGDMAPAASAANDNPFFGPRKTSYD